MPKKITDRSNRSNGEAESEFTVTLPNGSVVDLDSYDFGALRTTRQKLFCFWFTYPGTKAYHNKAEAARKAGYTPKMALSAVHIFQRDSVQEVIKRIESKTVKTLLEEAYNKVIMQKLNRAGFDVADFYREKEVVNPETGERKKVIAIKPIGELTEEQRQCVDGVDFKGQYAVPVYLLPNRSKETDDIIRLHERINGTAKADDFDVETTIDVIKGNLAAVKTTVRKKNEELSSIAGDYGGGSDVPEYD